MHDLHLPVNGGISQLSIDNDIWFVSVLQLDDSGSLGAPKQGNEEAEKEQVVCHFYGVTLS